MVVLFTGRLSAIVAASDLDPELKDCFMLSFINRVRQKSIGQRRRQTRLASSVNIDALEVRLMLAAAIADHNVRFETIGRNLWGAGSASILREDFEHSILSQQQGRFGFSAGGFGDFFGDTGAVLSVSGAASMGLNGFFEANGGAFDVGYQTDIRVSAVGVGQHISDVGAGERFILRASESADIGGTSTTRLTTSMPFIEAALNLEYGLKLNASLNAKFSGQSLVNETIVNLNHNDEFEIAGASANLNSGDLNVRLLGETVADGSELSFADPTGIFNGNVWVPQLGTTVADSVWDGSRLTNSNIDTHFSQRPTDNDFFRLGIGFDDLISTATGVPLNFSIPGDALSVDVGLIDAGLSAYLGATQITSFEPEVLVDVFFKDASGAPVRVSAETAPGSGVFESVSQVQIPAGQDLQVIRPGIELHLDTRYTLAGTFHNTTQVTLSPAFDLSLLSIETSGWLLDTASDLGFVNRNDFSFSAFERSFSLGNPIPVATLFDQSFPVSGFGTVDGRDLSLPAGLPTRLTVLPTVETNQLVEGDQLVVTGTLFDPVIPVSHVEYIFTAIWGDGTSRSYLASPTGFSADPNFRWEPATGTFTLRHTYQDEFAGAVHIGVRYLNPGLDIIYGGASSSFNVTVTNAIPQVSILDLAVNPSATGGEATLQASFTDSGLQDTHSVHVSWGDETTSTFNLPRTASLSVGTEFSSSGDTLRITSVNRDTGRVDFIILGHVYINAITGRLALRVSDPDGGERTVNRRVPWGLSVANIFVSSSVVEGSSARVEASFIARDAAFRQHDVVINWDDPNDARPSRFTMPSGLAGLVGTTVNSQSGDGATLRVTGFDIFTGRVFFRVTGRVYQDDGPADGNGTSSDRSQVVVEILERDDPIFGLGYKGATFVRNLWVYNAAPALSLDPIAQIGAGGVGILTGSFEDAGVQDDLTMTVNWGDGTPLEVLNYDASSLSRSFSLGHAFPSEGTYNVVVTLRDDDGRSVTRSASAVVNYNVAPVAYDDFLSVAANRRLTFDVLADNDTRDNQFGPDFDPDENGNYNGHLLPDQTINLTTPSAGMLTLLGNGRFQFNPNGEFDHLAPGEQADVSFEYQITDARGLTDTATATITVTGFDYTAVRQLIIEQDAVAEGILTFTGVIDGNSSPNFRISSAATDGLAAIDPTSGLWTYTPRSGFHGSDVFEVSITDDDGPLEVHQFLVTVLDGTPPASQVNSLLQRQSSATFAVKVSGSDDVVGSVASGVADFRIYRKVNGAPWEYWTTVPASNPTAMYTAASDQSIAFYSIARDRQGNLELKTPRIEASTYVPDVEAPLASIAAIDTSSAMFQIQLAGTDAGSSHLTAFEVFVAVDGGTPMSLGEISATADAGTGVYHASITYPAIADGAEHTYEFSVRGRDGAGNVGADPTQSAGTIVQATFAPPASLAVADFDVQKGADQRSFVRYLDVVFNQEEFGSLIDSINDADATNDRIRLVRRELDGSGTGELVSLAGNVSADGHKMLFDFGPHGIGGDRNSNIGNGYYQLQFDLDGNGNFQDSDDEELSFYRLFGDMNGDRRVDRNDLLAIKRAHGSAGEDVNGDGFVDRLDMLAARSNLGRLLDDELFLDD